MRKPALKWTRGVPAPARLGGFLPRGDSLPDAVWQRRHRFLVALLAVHALALPAIGIARGYGALHSLAEGGLLALAALVAVSGIGGRKLRSMAVAFGLLTSSALVVHFSGGYIEAHFHFFVMIVVLALYEDWSPFLLALAYVVVHHGIVGGLDPESVYNHPDAFAHPWRWAAVHGVAISFAAAMSLASWRLNEDLRAQKQAAVERAQRSEEELRRANAELQELDRLKSEFVSIASHELKTPLTSILGFASTLERRWDETSEEQRRQFVELIEEQAERLARLVGELLDISRIESAALPVKPEPIELAEALERACASFPDANIVISCPRGAEVFADPGHVEQMAINYLANALKYGASPVRVEVAKRNGSVELRVRDAGRGVPEDLLPRLFEKFSRAREANVQGLEGTGLGLAIVRGLAEANGGEAWYEHADGGGACFAIRLPAVTRVPARAGASAVPGLSR